MGGHDAQGSQRTSEQNTPTSDRSRTAHSPPSLVHQCKWGRSGDEATSHLQLQRDYCDETFAADCHLHSSRAQCARPVRCSCRDIRSAREYADKRPCKQDTFVPLEPRISSVKGLHRALGIRVARTRSLLTRRRKWLRCHGCKMMRRARVLQTTTEDSRDDRGALSGA